MLEGVAIFWEGLLFGYLEGGFRVGDKLLSGAQFSLFCKNLLSGRSYLLSSRILILLYTLILRIQWISPCEVIIRLREPQIILQQMVRLLCLLPQTLICCQRVVTEESTRSGVELRWVFHHLGRRHEFIRISQLVMHAPCILYLWVIQQVLNKRV